jgi:hypothetical protein
VLWVRGHVSKLSYPLKLAVDGWIGATELMLRRDVSVPAHINE